MPGAPLEGPPASAMVLSGRGDLVGWRLPQAGRLPLSDCGLGFEDFSWDVPSLGVERPAAPWDVSRSLGSA